jgi:excisionase family DNA binding protein
MRTDLTINEVAEITGRHPETLRRAARAGTLPGCYRLGHLWLIRREDFDAIRNGAANIKAGGAK